MTEVERGASELCLRQDCDQPGPYCVSHTEQDHHDASPCYEAACEFDHPHGGPFPHSEDEWVKTCKHQGCAGPCDHPSATAAKGDPAT